MHGYLKKRKSLPSILTPHHLYQAPKTQGLRPMTKKDVPVVHRLLREYLSQFSLVPAMNQEEVEHWLLPRENIIDTYLVEVTAALCPRCSRLRRPSAHTHCTCVSPVPTERWQGDRLPEFLHTALHHHEPPCAPQPEGSLLLLQRAHHHASARPDV